MIVRVGHRCLTDDLTDDMTDDMTDASWPQVPSGRSKADVVCDMQWRMPEATGPDGGCGDADGAAMPRGAPSGAPEVQGPGARSSGTCDGRTPLGSSVLFVDDTLAEHLHAEIRLNTSVVRFLFARSG
mmetsp:Transcript_68306/g.135360  ORF Transcript_68306/g.135360 Transcript_68306/m.135360 type:complete len:128 (-) Transcript_68306:38-421(-)